MIGSAEFLTDRAQILHLQQASCHVSQHVSLQCVRHHGIPHLLNLILWVAHRLGEYVAHLAFGIGDVLVLQCAALCRQRSDILFDEWQKCSLVVVAHEIEGEVFGIAIILLTHGQQTVVVDGLDVVGRRNACQFATQIDRALYRVLEHEVGVVALVGKDGGIGVLQVGKRFLVFLHSCHIEVDELHQCLDILRSALTAQSVVERIHGEVDTRLLASHGLFQFCAGEIAQTAGIQCLGHQHHTALIGFLKCRISHFGFCREENLVVFEVGLLHDHLRTVRQCQFLISQHLILYGLLDLASLR